MARQTSRSTFVRRPGAAALAVVVTFGLFYIMQALSAVSFDPTEQEEIR